MVTRHNSLAINQTDKEDDAAMVFIELASIIIDLAAPPLFLMWGLGLVFKDIPYSWVSFFGCFLVLVSIRWVTTSEEDTKGKMK